MQIDEVSKWGPCWSPTPRHDKHWGLKSANSYGLHSFLRPLVFTLAVERAAARAWAWFLWTPSHIQERPYRWYATQADADGQKWVLVTDVICKSQKPWGAGTSRVPGRWGWDVQPPAGGSLWEPISVTHLKKSWNDFHAFAGLPLQKACCKWLIPAFCTRGYCLQKWSISIKKNKTM